LKDLPLRFYLKIFKISIKQSGVDDLELDKFLSKISNFNPSLSLQKEK